MTTTASFDDITPAVALPSRLETATWFNAAHVSVDQSPIDEFLENLHEINKLYLGAAQRSEYVPVLGALAYLGMVSAFEGYMRALIRHLVLIDDVCKALATRRPVSYGAAMTHAPELLPEALLEESSFASRKNVASELRTICGISQMGKDGAVPPQLKMLFETFEALCHVRHCGVHRFGKLGSNQAMHLGLDSHTPCLEKPLSLSVAHLQDIALALEALVRGINSYCFADILRRTYRGGANDGPQYSWTWERDFALDETRFAGYYNVFASHRRPNSSPALGDMYEAFMVYARDADSRASSRRSRNGGPVSAGDGG